MKHKKIITLLLVFALTVTASGTAVFAASSAADTTSGATKQESQTEKPQTAQDDGSAAETPKTGSHRQKKQEVAEPENAIGKDAAKEKALSDAGLTAEQTGKVRSRVSTLEDGTVIYKVRFTYDGQKYSYKINAVTGEIVDKSNEAVTVDSEAGTHGHGKHGMKKSEESTSSSSAGIAAETV